MGGAKLTSIVLIVMMAGAGSVIYFLGTKQFGGFLASFMILFIASGIGSGSTFQMIPGIFVPKEAAPVLGFTAAFAAYGSFLIPKLFGWSVNISGGYVPAFFIFIGFYVLSIILNWYYYQRKESVAVFEAKKTTA